MIRFMLSKILELHEECTVSSLIEFCAVVLPNPLPVIRGRGGREWEGKVGNNKEGEGGWT